jgi:hypothetical protein
MRVIVDLQRTETGTVHDVVIADAEDIGKTHRFAGWLELLRVLEALSPPETSTSTGGENSGQPAIAQRAAQIVDCHAACGPCQRSGERTAPPGL